MKMKNIEDYQNLIELLKQALLFYADEKNYIGDIYRNSNIAVDQGSQARFALEKINEIENAYNDLDEYINKTIMNAMDSDLSFDDLMFTINNIRNTSKI